MGVRKHRRERLELVKALYKLGILGRGLARSMGMSYATVNDDVTILRREECFVGIPKKRRIVFQSVLEYYARFVAEVWSSDLNPNSLPIDSLGFKLYKALSQWLRIDEILVFLKDIEMMIKMLLVPVYSQEKAGYAELIYAIFGEPPLDFSLDLNDYLKEIADKKIPVPESYEALKRGLAEYYLAKYRSKIAPIWPDLAYAVVDQQIAKLREREELVIRQCFGIGRERKSYRQIGGELKVCRERARQIELKALRKLRHLKHANRLRFFVEPVNEAYRKYVLGLMVLAEFEKEKRSSEEEIKPSGAVSVIRDELLARRIEKLDFSVRAVNCLQTAGIETVGQLVQKSEQNLLKSRNFGRKTLREIKEVLQDLGLQLRDSQGGNF